MLYVCGRQIGRSRIAIYQGLLGLALSASISGCSLKLSRELAEAGAVVSGPQALLSGVPIGINEDVSLNVDVLGAGVTGYRYKLGPVATTDCADASGYGAEMPGSAKITDN